MRFDFDLIWSSTIVNFFGDLFSPAFLMILAEFLPIFLISYFIWLQVFKYKNFKSLFLLFGAYLTSLILKIIFKLPRPFVSQEGGSMGVDFLQTGDHMSFPSGHATILGFCVALLFYEKSPLRLTFFILSVLILLSRIALSAHYFLDIVLGILIGIFFASLAKKSKF